MRDGARVALMVFALTCASGANALGAAAAQDSVLGVVHPLSLEDSGQPETVYAPPEPPREDEGLNQGGVHFDLDIRYLNRYLYRGVIRFRNQGGGSSLNFQADGRLSFDLGNLPHPFVEVFTNIDDADSVSRFQEVRPTVGFDWNLKPFLITAGYIDYLFPEREKTNDTQEVFARLTFDDSTLWRMERPLLSPYVYGAYDIDRYNGWYFEAGMSHDLVIEDTGLKFTFLGDVAYVARSPQFRTAGSTEDTGFQHYELGLIGTYSLNQLFAVSKRYGEFDLKGYLFYTDGLENQLRSDTQLWGGVGLSFSY